MVSHRWLLQVREPEIKASHLSCAARAIVHGKGIVKVHGVFPSSCGQPASSPALQVRRVSRQDSRTFVTPFVQVGTYPTRNFAQLCYPSQLFSQQLLAIRLKQRRGVDISATLCMSPCSSDYIFSNKLFVGIWHIVSEDSSRISSVTSGAEAREIFAAVTARLRSRPTQTFALRAPDFLALSAEDFSYWPFLLIICTQRIVT